MASSLKFLCFFFVLSTLSSQIHARESQFFSKVTRNHEDPATTTTTTAPATTTNKAALKETEFVPLSSFKQDDHQVEEDPTFLPETEGSGYGFYGHETGLDPPSTTTTTTPSYNMEKINNNNLHDDHEMNYAKELKGLKEYSNIDNNNYYFDNNNNKVVDQGKYTTAYGGVEKQGMSDTRFLENGKYSYNGGAEYYGGAEKQGINNDFPQSTSSTKFLGSSKYYSTYGGAEYNGGAEKQGINDFADDKYHYSGYGDARYNGGVQKQGMSDTRFMENGKYFYDVNAENENNNNKFYNPNNNNNKFYNPSNNYNNEYMMKNNNGYYGNHKENIYGEFYNNNNNNYGYKNQVPQEEEFDFDP